MNEVIINILSTMYESCIQSSFCHTSCFLECPQSPSAVPVQLGPDTCGG